MSRIAISSCILNFAVFPRVSLIFDVSIVCANTLTRFVKFMSLVFATRLCPVRCKFKFQWSCYLCWWHGKDIVQQTTGADRLWPKGMRDRAWSIDIREVLLDYSSSVLICEYVSIIRTTLWDAGRLSRETTCLRSNQQWK